jgi:hypothetical protein
MLINLTNANPAFRGEPILIKSDIILTVYSGNAIREDGTVDRVTFVYAQPHGTWEVEDSVMDIYDKINRSQL